MSAHAIPDDLQELYDFCAAPGHAWHEINLGRVKPLIERIATLEDALRRIRDITAIDVGHGNITAHNIARAALAATEPK